MSTKNVENTQETRNLLAKQNDVDPAQCTTAAVTDALGAVAERTSASETRSCEEPTLAPLVGTSATTMVIDENDSISIVPAVSSAGGSARSSSSGGGGRDEGSGEKRRSSSGDKNNSKRKTRRGKTKRGKRSSSSRLYSKTQWKFQVPHLWTAANKRRAEATLGSSGASVIALKVPFLLSDQPPLVPYNTNRFLMEDHMPHVLTPSGRTRDSSFSIDSEENYFYSLPEDEEEFLTKEFSSVYEDARSERLEGLSKSQLIQEYLQLEANYEQVNRRFNAVKSLSIKEENESAVNNATTTKDAPEGGTDRRRLEDRVRELTTENLDLRRQLEHAARIGMVLSAKSSPRNSGNPVERMDSSSCGVTSSEDSESDSSSSTSSSSSDNDGSSSSSMSDAEDGAEGRLGPEDIERPQLPIVDEGGGIGVPMDEIGYLEQNGLHTGDQEDEEGPDLNEALSPLSPNSINSPPPPPLVMN